MIPGEHDFRRLAVHTTRRANALCRVRMAQWDTRGPGGDLRFRIAANRFLHHMVRILVATLVEVGQGRRPPGDIRALLEQHPGVRAAGPAPAEGLCFVTARYPAHWFTNVSTPSC